MVWYNLIRNTFGNRSLLCLIRMKSRKADGMQGSNSDLCGRFLAEACHNQVPLICEHWNKKDFLKHSEQWCIFFICHQIHCESNFERQVAWELKQWINPILHEWDLARLCLSNHQATIIRWSNIEDSWQHGPAC